MNSPADEYIPATQLELAEWMRHAAGQPPQPFCAAGGRTALSYGLPLAGPHQLISTARLTQVVDYPARDMTVTVEAGLRVDELASLLRGEGQRLAVDIAQSNRATLGGAIAVNTSGPRRFGLGTLRDYLIGVSAVDASGRLFKAGGRVVKNVAGYDLCKLLIGSLGTLAVVTQLTFKLKPLPESLALLWLDFATYDALDRAVEKLLTSAARPVAVEAFDPRGVRAVAQAATLDLPCGSPVLCLGLEGTGREVLWQADVLKDELAVEKPSSATLVNGPDANALWNALIEFAVPPNVPLTFKANLRPSQTIEFLRQAASAEVTCQAHAGNGIVIGRLPESIKTSDAANSLLEPLRSLARAGNGNLTILDCENSWKQTIPVFGDPAPAERLMRTLKSQLDPRDVFNRGRMFAVDAT